MITGLKIFSYWVTCIWSLSIALQKVDVLKLETEALICVLEVHLTSVWPYKVLRKQVLAIIKGAFRQI